MYCIYCLLFSQLSLIQDIVDSDQVYSENCKKVPVLTCMSMQKHEGGISWEVLKSARWRFLRLFSLLRLFSQLIHVLQVGATIRHLKGVSASCKMAAYIHVFPVFGFLRW
jgi:hypothetical protein